MTRHAGGGDGARGGGGGGGGGNEEEERREGVLFFGERGGGDPLSEWIEERQRAFRDFERSFHQHHGAAAPPPSLPLLPPPNHSLFSHGPAFGGPPQHILHHNQNSNYNNSVDFPAFLPPPPINQTVIPVEDVEDLAHYNNNNSNKMLSRSNNGNLDRDLSPKARVTYDEGRFQVEFDVRDYRPEELSIKTEGDVLIVLAKHETKTEGGGSFVSKQFEQRFTLPSGVQPESITSSLAKDGTLTVTAPRQKAVTSSQPEMQAIRAPSSPTSTSSPSKVYAHQDNSDNEGLPHPRVKYDEDKFQIALDCQKYRPEELDVKVEGNTIIITAKQVQKQTLRKCIRYCFEFDAYHMEKERGRHALIKRSLEH